MTDIKIIVATHKVYQMPYDQMYIPLHVGAEDKVDKDGQPLDLGYVKDNTGENISLLNPNFCELTGLYWAWKNLDADYIGLAHYRRHFSLKSRLKPTFSDVLTHEQLEQFLGEIKIFVPQKRRYYIESMYSHYAHTHYATQLDQTRAIIKIRHPEYILAFDKVMHRSSGYMWNMMIMRKELLEDYCQWLFPILFELQEMMGIQDISAFQNRFYGRISEIIFNVWLQRQFDVGNIRKSEVKELAAIHMEPINWNKKRMAFLQAKFLNKKYEGSF